MKDVILEEIVHAMAARPHAVWLWREPLAASASVDDPLVGSLKEWVHPGHLMPWELLPGARGIVAFFIPFSEQVSMGNAQGRFQSASWARAYRETNALIDEVGERLCRMLRSRGHKAVFVPATHDFDEETLTSRWSHRHVAFTAGLGTLGLNGMLITERGCCGRLGSIVTSARMEPDTRHRVEFCLFKRSGSCGLCVDRCPTGALTGTGLDKKECYANLLANAPLYPDIGWADACGKCVSGLPCSCRIP